MREMPDVNLQADVAVAKRFEALEAEIQRLYWHRLIVAVVCLPLGVGIGALV